MNLEKFDKEKSSMLDINKITNDLIKKIASIVVNKNNIKSKDLKEVILYLEKLKQVDKTISYTIFDDTIEQVNKALPLIKSDTDFENKEVVDVNSYTKKADKLDSEIRLTQEDIEKYNTILNDKIDSTVKNLNDVVLLLEENEKNNENNLERAIKLEAEKTAIDIVTSLFGESLKRFSKIELEKSVKEDKVADEIEISIKEDIEKKETKIQQSFTRENYKKDNKLEDDSFKAFENKIENNLESEIYKPNKEVNKVGTFPSFALKSKESLENTKEKQEKSLNELKDATKKYKEVNDLKTETEKESKTINLVNNTNKEGDKNSLSVDNNNFLSFLINYFLGVKRETTIFYNFYDKNDKNIEEISNTNPENKNIQESPAITQSQQKLTPDIDINKDYIIDKNTQNINNETEQKNKEKLDVETNINFTQKLEENISETEKHDKTINNTREVENKINKLETNIDNETSKTDKPIIRDYPEDFLSNEKFRSKPLILSDDINNIFKNFKIKNERFNPNAEISEENQEIKTVNDKIKYFNSITTTKITNKTVQTLEKIKTLKELIYFKQEGENSKKVVYYVDSKTSNTEENIISNKKTSGKLGKEEYDWLKSAVKRSKQLMRGSGSNIFESAINVLGNVLDYFSITEAEVSRFFYDTIRASNTGKNAGAISFGSPPSIITGSPGSRGINSLEKMRYISGEENINKRRELLYNKKILSEDDNIYYANDLRRFPFGKNENVSEEGYVYDKEIYKDFNEIKEISRGTINNLHSEVVSKPGLLVPDQSKFFSSADKEVFLKFIKVGVGDGKNIDRTINSLSDNELKDFTWTISKIIDKINNNKENKETQSSQNKGFYVYNQRNNEAEYINIDVSSPKTEELYIKKFKKRTIKILDKQATGYIKIYPRRALDFTTTANNNEDLIIPFQFEPEISGDSKSAEYNSVSTIGRSQPFHVYRNSSERNINLKLTYVVTGKTMDEDYEREAIEKSDRYVSKSLDGLENWDEDYIYNYILRNLKSLVLPNITDSAKWKLAPPIVQVWYGGIRDNVSSSTGSFIEDNENEKMDDIFPVFRTNWVVGPDMSNTYRSLWIVRSVSFDYKEGKINRITRNHLSFTADLQLTEISPSVVANEIFKWAKRKIAGGINA